MKHPTKQKKAMILVHMPLEIRKQVEQQAKKEGRSMASYVRKVLLRDLVRKDFNAHD